MQFSSVILFSILATLGAANNDDLLTAIKGDIDGNLVQYVSYISAHPGAEVNSLLALYEAAVTYTDTSYTTLVNDDELNAISSFATALPWYTRIEAEVGGASSTVESTSSSSSEAATSSAVETTSSSAEASSSSSAAESTAESSSAAESSTAESTTKASSTAESSSAAESATAASSSVAVVASSTGAGVKLDSRTSLSVVLGFVGLSAAMALI
ncbi:hypothetical protein CANARDRAFT_174389 [[Candida] arabinofermentans NRRL YB-2248]|uniref:Temperature shock-inducible protein 1 n=1 Tax=[Candida] arabinofermentans NRRL YB-2248 TaxID=983967 RepID=A0A1E4T6G6_9ASCO|nr:hypothetical protein CANARDRAFT_174389 [[Candida] arabinofermentans NRRL YB-2248]